MGVGGGGGGGGGYPAISMIKDIETYPALVSGNIIFYIIQQKSLKTDISIIS